MKRTARTTAAVLCGCMLALGCGSDAGGSSSEEEVPRVLTIGPNQGIDFGAAAVVTTGGAPFSKSDIYATANGDFLKLASGGAKITEANPVTWFKNGGIPRTFESHAQVPKTTPSADETEPLAKAQAGIGFVVKNHLDSGHTRCWIKSATADSVEIEFEAL